VAGAITRSQAGEHVEATVPRRRSRQDPISDAEYLPVPRLEERYASKQEADPQAAAARSKSGPQPQRRELWVVGQFDALEGNAVESKQRAQARGPQIPVARLRDGDGAAQRRALARAPGRVVQLPDSEGETQVSPGNRGLSFP